MTTNATSGYFSASTPRPMTNRLLEEAQRPVRERFGAGVGRDAGAGLGEVAAGRDGAADEPDDHLHHRRCSPSVATATSAPPAGRMNVCTVSHSESTHGILSATNSMA